MLIIAAVPLLFMDGYYLIGSSGGGGGSALNTGDGQIHIACPLSPRMKAQA